MDANPNGNPDYILIPYPRSIIDFYPGAAVHVHAYGDGYAITYRDGDGNIVASYLDAFTVPHERKPNGYWNSDASI